MSATSGTDPAAATGPDPAGGAGAGPARAEAPLDQRSRILAVAFQLMSEHGSASTSMRRLAGACGVNVATIYHYFPSKADLLRAVIEERHYGDRLAAETPPVDPELPATERLAALLDWLWAQTRAEHDVLRLIIGEGARGEGTARQSARTLVAALDSWLTGVLGDHIPELAHRGIPPEVAARVVRHHLLGLVAEHVTTGSEAEGTAADLAAALLP